MKSIKAFIAAIALVTSFSFFTAQAATVTGSTLEGAEAKIAIQAEYAGAGDYKITQAYTGNRVHMTAELPK